MRGTPAPTTRRRAAGRDSDHRDQIARRIGRYRAVRRRTVDLAAPLPVEDQVIQSMPDASPVKWHLAHVTWFFETFVLRPHVRGYRVFHPAFETLFNSYYEQVGTPYPRPRRGLLGRPTLREILDYREAVDAGLEDALGRPGALTADALAIVELGLQHEQQHQELILMDVKHLLAQNPLFPAYRPSPPAPAPPVGAPRLLWLDRRGGLLAAGHGGDGFCFDNERPRHRALVEPFRIASRLATCGEYLAFMKDGGYRRPDLWLSEGWDAVRAEGWRSPLYWRERDGAWWEFTLDGLREIDPAVPVCHVSYFEADAFATWSGSRLPTEFEWEVAVAGQPVRGNLLDSGRLHPVAAGPDEESPILQAFGDVWEWTRSPYAPYPRYRPPAGALGEYNGKFMVNQQVLRGGACVTPADHIRATYRNFYAPRTRWHFSGIRLARDA